MGPTSNGMGREGKTSGNWRKGMKEGKEGKGTKRGSKVPPPHLSPTLTTPPLSKTWLRHCQGWKMASKKKFFNLKNLKKEKMRFLGFFYFWSNFVQIVLNSIF